MARQEKLESLQQGSEDMSLLSGNFAKRSSTSAHARVYLQADA